MVNILENIPNWWIKRENILVFLQTWSTNASNFRAKKILKSFGVSCDIYWQSYWSIFRYCYLSYWMFETNFWDVASRFCIFGSVSERITWGEHPHQSMVLGHVHFKNTFFTECLQSENNTCWQKNLQQFQALFSMFVVKWCEKKAFIENKKTWCRSSRPYLCLCSSWCNGSYHSQKSGKTLITNMIIYTRTSLAWVLLLEAPLKAF